MVKWLRKHGPEVALAVGLFLVVAGGTFWVFWMTTGQRGLQRERRACHAICAPYGGRCEAPDNGVSYPMACIRDDGCRIVVDKTVGFLDSSTSVTMIGCEP